MGGEIDTPNCTLCGRTETTLYLMFECEKLAEPLWQLLAEIINADLRERGKQNNIVLHAYDVMYNLNIRGWRRPTVHRFNNSYKKSKEL